MRSFVHQRGLARAKQGVRRVAAVFLLLLFGVSLTPTANPQRRFSPQAGSAQPDTSDVAVRAVLIPTGYQQDKYTAMVQVAVDGSPLPNATWEIDASFESLAPARQDHSGRVEAREPDTPVVLEIQVEFPPGPYELELAARETTAGQSGKQRIEGRWPDPGDARATISPIVLLQPARGAFVRGENQRSQGALARGEKEKISNGFPIAFVSVVCRGTGLSGTLHIDRSVEGAARMSFDQIQLQPGRDRCAQVRDLIEPGRLLGGYFKYEVRLSTGGRKIISRVREFDTVEGAQAPRRQSALQGGRPAF